MPDSDGGTGQGGLEGLCEHGRARIRLGPGANGLERLEAHFPGIGFTPHRHDTYAIGITLSGLQTFCYRGSRHVCRPGQCHVLHPDEPHDGAAGGHDGFRYRIVYVDPGLIQQVLPGRALPFVADPVLGLSQPERLALAPAWDLADMLDDVAAADIVVSLAAVLARGSATPMRLGGLHLRGLWRVRDHLAADPAAWPSAAVLEVVAGLDRWTLARQFRAAFGTSPSRFRTMRQLDHARRMMRNGASLADSAACAGFADQSHLSRQFKRAFGLTPGQWLAAVEKRAGC